MMPFLAKVLLPVASFMSRSGFRIRRFLSLRYAPKPRPDDIFIAAYPKSGMTLMQMIVYQLKTDGNMDFPHINAVSPYYELELFKQNVRFLESISSPRFFKTHLSPHQLPMDAGRYIYIVRDVRDVVVSAYHHDLLISGMYQPLEHFTQKFLQTGWLPFQGFPTWFEHLEAWWPHRNAPNVLFLSYEKLVGDLEGTIRQVASFSKIDLREEDMPRILDRCSFAFMKQHEAKFDPRFQTSPQGSQGFIRKGKVGSGNELLPKHREMFDEKLAAVAQKLGCSGGEPYTDLVSGR